MFLADAIRGPRVSKEPSKLKNTNREHPKWARGLVRAVKNPQSCRANTEGELGL